MLGELLYMPKDIVDSDLFSTEPPPEGVDQKAKVDELATKLFNLPEPKSPDDYPLLLNGSVSFVEQQPWIQNESLRKNILFGSEFKKRKYVETVDACQLEEDLKLMTAGDRTEIGERGVTLSGGQKARLSLARAVYQDNDIFLMDDPISALDADVRKKVFKKVF